MADNFYITVKADGDVVTQDDPRVYISFIGPRGGTRAIETITLEDARRLRDALIENLGNPERTTK